MNSLLHIFHSHAIPRTSSFRNHRHTAFEMSLILSGEGKYLAGETYFPISGGDIFLYCTDEAHCITDITSEGGMEILNIHFEPRYFWNRPEEVCYLQTIFQRSQRHENRIPADSQLNAPLKNIILSCEKEYESAEIGNEEMLHSYLLSAFILLTRFDRNFPSADLPFSDKEQMVHINASMDYISVHYAEPLTLENLSRIAHMGKSYYCTVFKKLNGITPWKYLMIKRIDAAMRKLRTTPETVLDIALSCGFNNTANFNRIFLSLTDMTPKTYRSANRK